MARESLASRIDRALGVLVNGFTDEIVIRCANSPEAQDARRELEKIFGESYKYKVQADLTLYEKTRVINFNLVIKRKE